MTLFEQLSQSGTLIAERWRKTQPPENARLYRHVKEAGHFIWRTGQLYRFEDYLKSLDPERSAQAIASWAGQEGEDSRNARQILVQLREAAHSTADKNLIQIAIDQLDFIAATGQCDDFEDYLENFYTNPPPIIAHFGTRDEAEAWLKNLPEPPSSAHVLIGNDYFEVWYSRERGVRALKRDYALERFIESVTARGLPSPVASFTAHAEAEAWLASHPAPTLPAFITIAGEYHLAVYHKKIGRYTLHPISILEGGPGQST